MEHKKIKRTMRLLSIGILALCALACLESQVGDELPILPTMSIGPGEDIPPRQRGTTINPETQFKDPQAVNQTPAQSCVLDFASLNSEDIQRFSDLNNMYNYASTMIQIIIGGPQTLPTAIRESLDKALRNQNLQQNASKNCMVFKEKIKALAELMYVLSQAIYYAVPPKERGSAQFAQT